MIEISENDLQIIKDALYHYREEYRLGGDELELLRRVSVALGAKPEEAEKILA